MQMCADMKHSVARIGFDSAESGPSKMWLTSCLLNPPLAPTTIQPNSHGFLARLDVDTRHLQKVSLLACVAALPRLHPLPPRFDTAPRKAGSAEDDFQIRNCPQMICQK